MMNMAVMTVFAGSDGIEIIHQKELQNLQTIEGKEPEATDSSYDPRQLGVLPSVRYPGFLKDCLANSVAALIEINMIRKGMARPETADISELHMSYFHYNYTPDPLGGNRRGSGSRN